MNEFICGKCGAFIPMGDLTDLWLFRDHNGGVLVNGAWPIQVVPSPPICVTASVRRSGMNAAIP